MSNRSMVEINHDRVPMSDGALLEWAKELAAYIRGGRPSDLPRGVTFFNQRHHSEECPLGSPPHGWENDAPEFLEKAVRQPTKWVRTISARPSDGAVVLCRARPKKGGDLRTLVCRYHDGRFASIPGGWDYEVSHWASIELPE